MSIDFPFGPTPVSADVSMTFIATHGGGNFLSDYSPSGLASPSVHGLLWSQPSILVFRRSTDVGERAVESRQHAILYLREPAPRAVHQWLALHRPCSKGDAAAAGNYAKRWSVLWTFDAVSRLSARWLCGGSAIFDFPKWNCPRSTIAYAERETMQKLIETQPVEQNVRELTIPELDQIAGGIRDINVGVGQIDLSVFGSFQPIGLGVGRNQGGFEFG
jgi:hypothetical protein